MKAGRASIRYAKAFLEFAIENQKEKSVIQEMENIIFKGGTAACARIFLVGVPSDSLIEVLESNANIFACSVSTI